jgi:amino-acid N-acetyltransferase
MIVRRIRAVDLAAAEALLISTRLPTEELILHIDNVFAAWDGAAMVGVVGLEDHGGLGLLRSLAVAESHRRKGLARLLCDTVLARAATLGLPEIWLLTTTAEDWFLRAGFERVDRDHAPPCVRTHRQFTGLCPASAVLMRRLLAT